MEEIRVRTAGGEYAVYVGRRLYESKLAEDLVGLRTRKVVAVSHPSLYELHGKRLRAVFESLPGGPVEELRFLFPQGEEHKNLETLEEGYAALLEGGMTREDVLLAFGGGVVGDLAGFIAATYMRGIRYAQVPTTLMAMVDSSIGGKVGVDLRGAKNAAGSFYQPLAVYCDTGVLETLPAREMRSGLAEVAKYGFLYDATLLRDLEARTSEPACIDEALKGMIARCAGLKARAVEADERDTGGIRSMLNYGHTFGHALESACGLGTLRHGEAVAVGMMMAARLSESMGLARQDLYEVHCSALMPLLTGISFPGDIGARTLIGRMHSDKKRGVRLRFVLLERMQAPRLVEAVPEDLVETAVEDTLSDLRRRTP
jgi:3-dehydroquinate synthase